MNGRVPHFPGGRCDGPGGAPLRVSGMIVAALLALAAGTARGAPPSPAEKQAQPLVERGLEALRGSQYGLALEHFKQAYDIWPVPAVEARMGFAEQGLSLWIDAERHLERALQAGEDRFVAQNRKTIERALAEVRKHLGHLLVTGGPEGAQVKIDGITRGLLPVAGPVRTVEGEWPVEISHPGFTTQRHLVRVSPGQTLALDVQLRRAGQDGASATAINTRVLREPPAPGGAAATSRAARPGPAPADGALAAGSGDSLRTAAWVGLLAGVPVAAGGFWLHASNTDRREPITAGEWLPLAAGALGAAVAWAGGQYLVASWLLVPAAAPSEHGPRVGLALGRSF